MDTGTHFVFGLGLGGLAMIDPVISSHPYGAAAILLGTVAGSNAPDLDMLLRLKSNADYIKNHRGMSHSLPAIFIWTGLITLCLTLAFRDIPWWHLGFWVFVSVVVHVFSDLFNAYGTQAYRPISKEWVKWNIIHIFDPFIFSAHVLAILLWASGSAEPRVIFPVLYVLLAIYYVWRTAVHRKLSRKVSSSDPEGRRGDRYTLLPTISPYRWNVVRRSEDGLYGVGVWERGRLHWHDTLSCDDHPAAEASKSHPDIQAFLGITPFPCASVKVQTWGYEVRWVDIRYRYRKQYPFVAVVMMDSSYRPLQSYVGWLSEDRLEKRLRMTTY
ncbi:metal-dependent hydrolase [Cohnella candidum]|uniref:Metal-dependent hydrolase n=1 Tax=Cohnella candidum TaxID=2674991 RepID=A0A3G3JV15_9BACL|nr:metal-dependent hydrolase [Cohnella candidum]AYQ71349.1 metal-dependent hydrolase [Cohnella candidum]